MQRSTSSTTDWRAQATHLVVFQHGLWGNEKDFRNFQTLFQQYFPQDEIYTHVAKSNATSLASIFQTYDGIDVGGTRLADEVLEVAKAMPRLAKFSIAGHSLGGLYSRYCIGVLFARGFFEDIEPMNFISLASPHMGIRRTQKSAPWNIVYNAIAPSFFDLTGQQFTLTDTASEEAVALSNSVRKYPHRKRFTVYTEMEGVLSVRVSQTATSSCVERVRPQLEATAFEPMECKLDSDGFLRVYRLPQEVTADSSSGGVEADIRSSALADPKKPKTGFAGEAESADNPQKAVHSESIEDSEAARDAEGVEHIEGAEEAEGAEDAEEGRDPGAAEEADEDEDVEGAEEAEETESAKDPADTGDAEDADDDDDVEGGEGAEEANETEGTEDPGDAGDAEGAEDSDHIEGADETKCAQDAEGAEGADRADDAAGAKEAGDTEETKETRKVAECTTSGDNGDTWEEGAEKDAIANGGHGRTITTERLRTCTQVKPDNAPATVAEAVAVVAQVDLVEATVTVSLPEQDGKARRRSFSRRKSSSSSSLHRESLYWEIEIVQAPSATDFSQDRTTITIRIPCTELAAQWKWVAAVSNASHGVFCRSQNVPDKPVKPVAPSLLSCLTRGQFLQALQLFRARALYASIFHDLQVPYSCGSIRAFNPYRAETEPVDQSRSPFYQHIVMRSLWNAPLLRDTLPEDVAARAERSSSISRFSLVKSLGERHDSKSRGSHSSRQHSSFSMSFSKFLSSSSSESRSIRESLEQPPPFSASSSISSVSSSSSSSSFFQRRLGTIPQAPSNSVIDIVEENEAQAKSEPETSEPSFFFARETKRPPPFEDGSLLLDHADHAFSNDALRDELRGMMLSLQSVGWRRIDVSFHSPLAHMKIIAMTANPTKPLSKGLDVVHHVMDTFLL